jgi:hypothetical protein
MHYVKEAISILIRVLNAFFCVGHRPDFGGVCQEILHSVAKSRNDELGRNEAVLIGWVSVGARFFCRRFDRVCLTNHIHGCPESTPALVVPFPNTNSALFEEQRRIVVAVLAAPISAGTY